MNRRRGPKTLDLTLGEPGRGPEPGLMEAARAAFLRGTQGYTENAGLLELREAIAQHHHRSGPEEVIVTVGSEQAVYLALTCILTPGSEVLIPDPGYPAYPGIATLLGARAIRYPVRLEGGLVPSIEDLERLGTEKTRAVLWNTPSNPFGAIPGPELTSALVHLARRRGWAIISDEIYRDLRFREGAMVSPAREDADVLLVSGLSKSCAMTGFRLGYLCGPAEFVQKATLAHQLMVTCAPRLSQLMALEVFRDPAYLTLHKPRYLEARDRLQAAGESLPRPSMLHLGDAAFYAVLDVRPWLGAGGTFKLACRLLDAEDVAVVPGVAFGPRGDWFLRVSYAGDVDKTVEGVQRIGRFLRGLSSSAD